jgi:hypothetical protein
MWDLWLFITYVISSIHYTVHCVSNPIQILINTYIHNQWTEFSWNGQIGRNVHCLVALENKVDQDSVLDHSMADIIVVETFKRTEHVTNTIVQVWCAFLVFHLKAFSANLSQTWLPSTPITVDGVWNPWGSWEDCDVSCGGGNQSRERTCLGPFYGGAPCNGSSIDTQECNTFPCPGRLIIVNANMSWYSSVINSFHNIIAQFVSDHFGHGWISGIPSSWYRSPASLS